MRNRVFFSQEALDTWLGDGKADLRADDLLLKEPGRRFRIIEAVRVLREVSGTADPNELVGTVKSRAFLLELGAELLEGSLVLGDNAYDVEPGFVGAPIGSFAEHRKASPGGLTGAATSDEELLLAFAKN